MVKPLIFETSRNNKIRCDFYESSESNVPLIIYSHGFKGFKNWGFTPYTSNKFQENGFNVLTINFSHNGLATNPENFSEEEKFFKNTHSLQLEELVEIIQAVRSGNLFKKNYQGKICLWGHSFGGALAILAASNRKDIAGVLSWAAVSSYNRYSEDAMIAWTTSGKREIKNARTGQILFQGIEILNDILAHSKDTLNIEKAISELAIPVLLIHGKTDESVTINEFENLSKVADKAFLKTQLIEDADHVFNVKHPFMGSTYALDQVIKSSLKFLKSL